MVALLVGVAIGDSIVVSNSIVGTVRPKPITGIVFCINGTTDTNRIWTEGDTLNFTATVTPIVSGRTIYFCSNTTRISGTYTTDVNGFVQGPVITLGIANINTYNFTATT
jgi:hypothetical protein